METSGGDQAFTREDLYGMGNEKTYAGALSFMRRKYSRDLAGVDVAVLGVPFDLAVTNRPGARFGPQGVRRASAQLAWGKPWPWNFDPFERLAVVDYGDCPFDFGYPDKIPDEIEACAHSIIEQGVSLLSIGGDHFLTYPLLKAHARVHGPLSLVHFDAHSDTWSEDDDRIDHGTMFYHAAKDGLVAPERSVQIGMRTHNDETHDFNVHDANWVHDNGTGAVVEEIRRIVGDNKAYLTFDIDCLDPCYAPGTGTPVVGGLSTHQARSILHGIAGIDFVGMDLVEVSPMYDVGDITSLAGATLMLDWLCMKASRMPERKAP